ncbi:hypothetical protein A2382_01820 [Candidatus Woesebacteria bacterium RIFOXYB1_FULL_38_16]|uniref:Uncharacterized protein n=1 Tax=Candidatus Woesebacteria bacterium RIFOXYB1_FULL_38_16 TaxID=1802538 RepID=A0A1F8CUX6_9BACT|nr:MAG: hypothetical protein A2191_02705 [Candidatus Woesebacteria bacterium RIFOXYA1_FULL_38_9]OGM79639.1 MAG: hypothetical protein A2382_01820 [Candidatus Woesebacteria bacterium RIFOXYB1_FULL_38_16]
MQEQDKPELDITDLFKMPDLIHDPIEKVKEWVEKSFPNESQNSMLERINEARSKSNQPINSKYK